MLKTLSVENFAVTKTAHLDFTGGFCALTGETGAGKSMMVDALTAALGSRSDVSWVRQGCSKATVSAVFDASEQAKVWLHARGIGCEDGEVSLRRVIESEGRSKAWINGVSVSAGEAREIGSMLAAIHGQHESVALLGAKAQREHLDAYAKNHSLLGQVAAAYQAWTDSRDAAAHAEALAESLGKERSQLAWELDEITRVNPKAGEWEELEAVQSQLSQAVEIGQACDQAVNELVDGEEAICDRLSKLSRKLGAFSASRLREISLILEQAGELASDAARNLARFNEAEDMSSSRMAKIDERLGEIHALSRKLRQSPSELPARAHEAKKRLDQIEEGIDASKLQKRERDAFVQLQLACSLLTRARRAAGDKLGSATSANLGKLGMGKAKVSVEIHPKTPGPEGADIIEFVMAGREGAKPLLLAKCASGGELARIGLALCAASLEQDQPGCMVFDEIDAGIGGPTAIKVGQMLSKIGAKGQALAVTHLPQVAAMADMHYFVGKKMVVDGFESIVKAVQGVEREHEIARMLGDSKSGSALEHARALLSGA